MATYVPYAFKDPIADRLRILNAAQADLKFVLECAGLQDEQLQKMHGGISATDNGHSSLLYYMSYITGVTIYARCFTHGKRSLHGILSSGGIKKSYSLLGGTDEINRIHDFYMRIRSRQLGHVAGSLESNYVCLQISENSTPETVSLCFQGLQDRPSLFHRDHDIRTPVNFCLERLSALIAEEKEKIMNYVKSKDVSYLKQWGDFTHPNMTLRAAELINKSWEKH